jgi:glycosyltransferase involved in cell wall biosynthesis
MKRVLMIAYIYPPQGGPGVQRTVKFVRYLPRYGWEPLVLTVREPYDNTNIDSSMLAEVAHVRAVAKTRHLTCRSFTRFWAACGWLLAPLLLLAGRRPADLPDAMLWRTAKCLYPDLEATWLPTAILEGLAMVRRYRPQVLYATSPPSTDLLVGLGLSWLTRLPLVVDFRDPWATNFAPFGDGMWRRRLDAHLERLVVNRAACVISVTPRMTETLVNDYRQVPRERFVTISNGYDPEDSPPAPAVRPDAGRFCIAHLGSCFGTRSPAVFLQALQRVFASTPQMRQDLRVRFVGQVESGKELLAAPEFADIVESTGPVDHRAAATYLVTSDILLLIQHPGALVGTTGKVFEYLAAPGHILACGPPDGEAAAFLRQAGGATIVDGSDPAAVAEAIRRLYAAWKQGTLDGRRDPAIVRQFDRRELTRQLATVLDECCERSPLLKASRA